MVSKTTLAVEKGDAEAEGVSRTGVRGGQRLAQTSSLLSSGTGAGQHSGSGDRRGPEYQASAQQTWVGMPP